VQSGLVAAMIFGRHGALCRGDSTVLMSGLKQDRLGPVFAGPKAGASTAQWITQNNSTRNESMKIVLSTILAVSLMVSIVGSARADDAEMYGKKCAGCHGKDGKAATSIGKKLNMKDLTDPKVQAASTDAQWEKLILDGVKGADGKTVMPATKISADEAKGLVKYVRSLKKK
jgi:hypothetical protein